MIGIISNTDLTSLRHAFPAEPCVYSTLHHRDLSVEACHSLEGADRILFFISGEELLRGYYYRCPAEELYYHVLSRVEELLRAIELIVTQRPGAAMAINNIAFPPGSYFPFLQDAAQPDFPALECLINKKISAFADRFRNLVVLDWQRLIKTHGYIKFLESDCIDATGVNFSTDALAEMGREFDELTAAWSIAES